MHININKFIVQDQTCDDDPHFREVTINLTEVLTRFSVASKSAKLHVVQVQSIARDLVRLAYGVEIADKPIVYKEHYIGFRFRRNLKRELGKRGRQLAKDVVEQLIDANYHDPDVIDILDWIQELDEDTRWSVELLEEHSDKLLYKAFLRRVKREFCRQLEAVDKGNKRTLLIKWEGDSSVSYTLLGCETGTANWDDLNYTLLTFPSDDGDATTIQQILDADIACHNCWVIESTDEIDGIVKGEED